MESAEQRQAQEFQLQVNDWIGKFVEEANADCAELRDELTAEQQLAANWKAAAEDAERAAAAARSSAPIPRASPPAGASTLVQAVAPLPAVAVDDIESTESSGEEFQRKRTPAKPIELAPIPIAGGFCHG